MANKATMTAAMSHRASMLDAITVENALQLSFYFRGIRSEDCVNSK
jgi:hypothetical protein